MSDSELPCVQNTWKMKFLRDLEVAYAAKHDIGGFDIGHLGDGKRHPSYKSL
jgi:hypothetical protein